MPTRLKFPGLFAMVVDNREVAIVRAKSQAEAREHWLENHLQVEKLTVSRAFALGARNECGIEDAKPEYAEVDGAQTDMFPTGADDASTAAPEVPHV